MKYIIMNLAALCLAMAIVLVDKGNSVWAFMGGGFCVAACIHLTVLASYLFNKEEK